MIWTPVAFDPRPGPLLHVASGLLLVALAAFVASVKPRRRANLAFAGFSGGWGLAVVSGWAFNNYPGVLVVAPESGWYLASKTVSLLSTAVAAACLPLVALWFPRRIAARERPFVRVAAVGAGAFAVVAAAVYVAGWAGTQRDYVASGFPALAANIIVGYEAAAHVARTAGTLFALILLALRARLAHREGRDAERRQYVLMTVALLLHPGVNAGITAGRVPLASGLGATVIVRYAIFCAVAALWLSDTRLGPGPGARAARNVALLTVALPLAGWVLYVFFHDVVDVGAPPGIGGAARTITVLTLAYAILQHQLLGIDVKVRWTISKSTVAAVFVGVFFVVSEAAQQFLGDALGSQYVGIAAAGALVFAMAPLQRAAERLAKKAVPVTPASAGSSAPVDESHDLYRYALRLALADRTVSPEEEMKLARLAERLGLTPTDVTRVRQEVEAARPAADKGGGA